MLVPLCHERVVSGTFHMATAPYDLYAFCGDLREAKWRH